MHGFGVALGDHDAILGAFGACLIIQTALYVTAHAAVALTAFVHSLISFYDSEFFIF